MKRRSFIQGLAGAVGLLGAGTALVRDTSIPTPPEPAASATTTEEMYVMCSRCGTKHKAIALTSLCTKCMINELIDSRLMTEYPDQPGFILKRGAVVWPILKL